MKDIILVWIIVQIILGGMVSHDMLANLDKPNYCIQKNEDANAELPNKLVFAMLPISISMMLTTVPVIIQFCKNHSSSTIQ